MLRNLISRVVEIVTSEMPAEKGKKSRRGKRSAPYHRGLHFESLENRELLAVTGAEWTQLQTLVVEEAPSTVVTTLYDVVDKYDGIISLREAISYAGTNGLGTTVTFAAQGTFVLNGNALSINKSITIDGDGAITVDGNQKSRVFSIGGTNTSVALTGLTITGGSLGSSSTYGGGDRWRNPQHRHTDRNEQ